VCELGAKISDQQHAMIERLESLVGYFLLAEPVAAAELGRAGEKLSKICDAVIQLPSTVPDISWDEMASFLDMIHRDFDPYSSTAAAPDQQTHHDASGEPVPDQNRQLGVDVPLSVSPAKPVIAERIKWKLGPTFNPEPFWLILLFKLLSKTLMSCVNLQLTGQPSGERECIATELN
jgi:hypothetical protein